MRVHGDGRTGELIQLGWVVDVICLISKHCSRHTNYAGLSTHYRGNSPIPPSPLALTDNTQLPAIQPSITIPLHMEFKSNLPLSHKDSSVL
jgi:hypothetical protein